VTYRYNAITALWMILMSGCVPAIKNNAEKIKEVKIPVHLITSNSAVTNGNDENKMNEWWRIFKNNELEDLLKLAQQDNPSISEARSRLDIAQAELRQSKSTQLPRVDAAASITRLHYSDNGDHGIYNGETHTVRVADPLIINYRPDFFGKDKEVIASAAAHSEVHKALLTGSLISLRQSVIKTYFSLITADDLVKTQLEIIQLAKEIENINIIALQAGLQPASAVLPIRLYLDQSNVSLSLINQRKSALQYALSHLLGRGPDKVIEPQQNRLHIPKQLPIPETINLDSISRRPDIQAALWKIYYAAHMEKVAQKDFYPNINIRALLGFNSLRLANLIDSGSLTHAVGPALSLPIFNHNELKSRFDAATAAYDAAVFAYNHSVLNAAKEVATNLENLENTKNILESQSLILENRATYAESIHAEFNSGISNKSSYLEALINNKLAYADFLQSRLNWLCAITDMATALDGELKKAGNDIQN
jgi:NodT family efflux transporter outer membrane factor (OMF) lipoprotein